MFYANIFKDNANVNGPAPAPPSGGDSGGGSDLVGGFTYSQYRFSQYPGYANFETDLVAWYKFEDVINGTGGTVKNSIEGDGTNNSNLTVQNKGSKRRDYYPGYEGHEDDLMAWYKFDGDLKDSSGNGNDLTETAVFSSTAVRHTGSISLNGSSHKYRIDNKFNIGEIQQTKGLTLCGWYYMIDDTQIGNLIFLTSSGSPSSKLMIRQHVNNFITQVFYNSTGMNNTTPVSMNTWYHIVLTLSSGTLNNVVGNLYFNGVLIESVANCGEISTSQNDGTHKQTFIFGRESSEYFEGYIDDFRIYNKALSADEVKAVYGYTLSRQEGVHTPYSYYWSGATSDASDNAYLQGTVPTLSGDYSISFWNKQDTRGDAEIFSIGSTPDLSFTISSNLHVKLNDKEFLNQADTDWHFWTVIGDNTNSTIKLYRDSRELPQATALGHVDISTKDLYIGCNISTLEDTSKGYLEDFRIWNKALSHSEMVDCMGTFPGYNNHGNDLYLWYKFEDFPFSTDYNNTQIIKDYAADALADVKDASVANYSFNSKEYTGYFDHEKDLVAWYKFDGNLNDSSGKENTLTSDSTPSFSKSNNVRGISSYDVSGGTANKLSLNYDLQTIQRNTGITFAFWAYNGIEEQYRYYINLQNNPDYFWIRAQSNGFNLASEGNGTNVSVNFGNENKWHHIVVSITSGQDSSNPNNIVLTLYLNGVLVSTHLSSM